MPKLTNNHVQSFEIRHLLYGDAIFNEANNKMFHWRFESIKWISFLASGIVRETKKKTINNLALNTSSVEVGLQNF